MRNIKLHNKEFEVFINETEISSLVHSIAKNINETQIKILFSLLCLMAHFYLLQI